MTQAIWHSLKEKMHEADIFCDATGVGMHPLEDLSISRIRPISARI